MSGSEPVIPQFPDQICGSASRPITGELLRSDRTVHAECRTFEVVRYERAGKWYVETLDGEIRQHVGVFDAAQRALAAEVLGGSVFARLPGGSSFDQKVRMLRARFKQPEQS